MKKPALALMHSMMRATARREFEQVEYDRTEPY